MCIVIDTSTISRVFNSQNSEHQRYKPVLDWLVKGKGKIVFGGSTYWKELKKMRKFLRIILEFRRFRKVVLIDDKTVNQTENVIKGLVVGKNFNDAHIIAIVIVSKCKLVCSADKESYLFLTDKKLYPKHFTRPRIYKGAKSNINLLCDRYIADICKPCIRITKHRIYSILELLN